MPNALRFVFNLESGAGQPENDHSKQLDYIEVFFRAAIKKKERKIGYASSLPLSQQNGLLSKTKVVLNRSHVHWIKNHLVLLCRSDYTPILEQSNKAFQQDVRNLS